MVRYSTRLSLFPRPSSDGSLAIRLRVCWSAHRVDVSTGLSAPSPSVWDAERQCFVSSFRTVAGVPAVSLNRQLRSVVAAVDDVFARFDLDHRRPPSVEELRSSVAVALGRAPVPAPGADVDAEPSAYDVLRQFVTQMGVQNGWGERTHYKFTTLSVHLREIDPSGELRLSQMDEPWLQRFMANLTRSGLRNTTAIKSLSILKWFLRWAVAHGYPVPPDFVEFRPRLRGTEPSSHQVVYLEWDELMAVWDCDLSSMPHLEQVRDVFCFCCFSGLRYSDVSHLHRSDVYGDYIAVVTNKTADSLRIELNEWTRAVLARYAGREFPGGLALPVISNQKMNAYLKDVGRAAGLDAVQRMVYYQGSRRVEEVIEKWRLLTTHCARRTFVVHALRLGISAEVIMKWTGHSSFKAMRPYVAIVDELKAESMARFNNMPKPDAGGSSSGSGSP